MLKKYASLLIAPMLNGCVGVITDFTVSKDETYAYLENGDRFFVGELRGLEKGKILDKMGRPNEIVRSEPGKETWVYPYETAWKGVILAVVIVPVPLRIPTGKLNSRIEFDENIVSGVSHEHITGNFYACGPGFWAMTAMTNGKAMFCGIDD